MDGEGMVVRLEAVGTECSRTMHDKTGQIRANTQQQKGGQRGTKRDKSEQSIAEIGETISARGGLGQAAQRWSQSLPSVIPPLCFTVL